MTHALSANKALAGAKGVPIDNMNKVAITYRQET